MLKSVHGYHCNIVRFVL